jgi:hypothetical protein
LAEQRDVAQALVTLVSFATASGVKNATYTIDAGPGQPDVEVTKASLELSGNLVRSTRSIELFGGMGIHRIHLVRPIEIPRDDGDPARLTLERDLQAARLSGGLSLRITRHLRATPYVSFTYASISGDVPDPGAFMPQFLLEAFETSSATVSGTAELKYDRWLKLQRVVVIGHVIYGYTRTFDESDAQLAASGDMTVLDVEGRWTGPTGLRLQGLPVRWKLVGGYTELLDAEKDSLGFRRFLEYGGGADLALDVKVLDLFNLRYLGLIFTGIVGDDVTGWSFGLTFGN